MKNFILATLIFSAGLANAGEKRGPGNPVEAGFKEYAIKLASNLVKLPADIQASLRFNPNDLLAQSYAVSPQCAGHDDITILHKKNKLAYVLGKKPNTITLDCTGYTDGIPPIWQKVFVGKDVELNVFMVHEILRTMGVENENTYLSSGSLAVVDVKIKEMEIEKIRLILQSTTPFQEIKGNCKFDLKDNCVDYFSFSSCTTVALYLNNTLISERYLKNSSISKLRVEMLSPDRDPNSTAGEIVKEMRYAGCFQ